MVNPLILKTSLCEIKEKMYELPTDISKILLKVVLKIENPFKLDPYDSFTSLHVYTMFKTFHTFFYSNSQTKHILNEVKNTLCMYPLQLIVLILCDIQIQISTAPAFNLITEC